MILTDSTAMAGGGFSRLLTGTRLDPRDSTGFSILVISVVLLVGLAGATASFDGQMAVAGWAMLDGPIAFAVPVVIDGSIVIFSLAAILQRSRGQSTAVSWIFVGLFTAISIGANSAHVLIESQATGETLIVKAIGGAFVAGMMPVSIWLVTHVLTDLLVQKPELAPDELRARIAQEIEAENTERARLADVAAVERRADDERKLQLEREVAQEADWDRIKHSPESSVNGTEDRKLFVSRILDVYEREGQNASRTADRLGITYARVRSVLNSFELETSR